MVVNTKKTDDARQYSGYLKLIDYVHKEQICEVSDLLENGVKPNYENEEYSPLHTAAWGSQYEMTHLLLGYGADVNAVERTGKTPIFNAFDKRIIRLLIEFGADVNVQDKHDHNTALHGDVMFHNPVKEFIESGFDLTLKNRFGWNVLHMQVGYGNDKIVSELLKYGFDLDSQTDCGRTALEIAELYKHDQCFRVLEKHVLSSSVNYRKNIEDGLGL